MVLDGLSESDLNDYIISLFKNYLDEFEDSLIDPKKALSKLINSTEINEFVHKYKMILLACDKNLVKELDFRIYKVIRDVLIEQSLFNLITKKRISIPIEKSRYLIGVLDETGQLDENEIFVSYRGPNGQMEFLNNQLVIVGRNPCYSLSEVRKVRARFLSDLEHLENCVVFPKKGKRPLVNILSGGDLDGDIYFVSWDENLTRIQNSEKIIDYPEGSTTKNDLNEDDKNLWMKLVDNFAKRISNQDKIGLWHYYLISQYDKDRENMKQANYIDGVIEINKCIDGILSVKNSPKSKKPDWYLTSNDLLSLDKLETREEKFLILEKILKAKNFDSVEEQLISNRSLLSCLTQMAIKKFLDIVSKKEEENFKASFLDQEDIDLLIKYKKISLDISNESIKKKNLNKIKQEYENFVKNIKRIDKKNIKSENFTLYQGMYERQTRENSSSKKEIEKVELIEEFRNFVINLKYSSEEIFEENLRQSVFCLDGFYFRSRLVSLYLDLKDENVFYQIPWMFYDVLCYLKNFCNDKRSKRTLSSLPSLVPFTIAAECTSVLSTKKLSIFNKI